jgi:hypothetical protein
MKENVITKQSIARSLANALMRLGKNDWEAALWNIDKAREQLVLYRQERLESKTVERFLGEPNPLEGDTKSFPADSMDY